MDLIAVETPAAGIALSRQALKLLDASLRIVAADYGFQIVADHLIETLAEGFRTLPRLGDELFIDG
jgi:hypothetical protein